MSVKRIDDGKGENTPAIISLGNFSGRSISELEKFMDREKAEERQAIIAFPAHNIIVSMRKTKKRAFIEVLNPKPKNEEDQIIRITCSQIIGKPVKNAFIKAQLSGEMPLILYGNKEALSTSLAEWLLSGGHTVRYTYIRESEDIAWLREMCVIAIGEWGLEAKAYHEFTTGENAFLDKDVRTIYISNESLRDKVLPEMAKSTHRSVYTAIEKYLKDNPQFFSNPTKEEKTAFTAEVTKSIMESMTPVLQFHRNELLQLGDEIKQIEGEKLG